MPRVAVIIVTYLNKEALTDLARLLPSLEALTCDRQRWEIVLVDNPASTGRCAEYLEREWLPRAGKTLPPVTLVKCETNTGFAGGNIRGVRVAREHGCDFAYLLNQDTDLDPSALHEVMETMERDARVGLVQSLLMLGGEPDRVNSWGNAFHFLGYSWCGGYRKTAAEAKDHFAAEKAAGNAAHEIPSASGAAVLVRLAALGTDDIFDEKFFLYHEDVDLSLRIRLAGWRAAVSPWSVVRHHYVFARSMTKFRWMERNRLVVLFSVLKWPTLALLALPFAGVELISLAFAAKGGWFGEKIAAYRMLFEPGAGRWIADRRRRVQAGRKITDRELLRTAEARILFQEGEAGGFVMKNIANPVMTAVWCVIYFLIRW